VRELFPKKYPYLPYLVSVLLAISPWHINLSRAGFEATIAHFFVVSGIYLFLVSQRRPKVLLFAWIPFALSIYTFNSARYVVILLSIGLILFIRKEILKNKRLFLGGIVVFFIILIPILGHLISAESRLRFTEVSIFTDQETIEAANARMEQDGNTFFSKLVHNRRIGYLRLYILHFLDHFQPSFLFIRGDGNPKFSIQEVGQLYLLEAPFLVLGLTMFLKEPRIALLLLWWLIAGIIPAAAARETPHALRILNTLPTWQIFIAYGIVETFQSIQNPRRRSFLAVIILGGYLWSVAYYLHNYFVHYPREYASEWQYGYREAIHEIKDIYKNYDEVRITGKIGRPYMYTLFYLQFDPEEYFKTKRSYFDASGFYHVDGFANFVFGSNTQSEHESPGRKVLIIEDVQRYPGTGALSVVRLPNGDPTLVIYEK
jgi:hypothetical protein